MRLNTLAMVVVAMSLLHNCVFARQVKNWSYEQLFNEADVVVIASPQTTDDSDDEATIERWEKNLVGQRTTFEVHLTLKGTVAAEPLTVLHFRLKKGVIVQDGPRLAAFRSKGPTIEGGASLNFKAQLGKPQYLLFLKATDEGKYEPVSGQIDAVDAVKEIFSPLPAVIDQADNAHALIVPGERIGGFVIGASTLAEILGEDTREARRRFADQGVNFTFNQGRELTGVTVGSERFATKEGLKVGSSVEDVKKALGAPRAQQVKGRKFELDALVYDGITFFPKGGRIAAIRVGK